MSRQFRICMAKGGRESARPSWSRPKLTLILRGKKIAFDGVAITWQAAILTLEQNPPERKFLTYIKIFSQEDLALKSKLRPGGFLLHRPIFAGNSRSTGIFQLQAGKTQSKKISTRLSFTYSESWVSKDSVGAYPEKVSVENFGVGSDLRKFSVFTNFYCQLQKKNVALLRKQFWCHRPSRWLVWTVIPQSFQRKPKNWPGVNSLASRSSQRKVMPIFVP